MVVRAGQADAPGGVGGDPLPVEGAPSVAVDAQLAVVGDLADIDDHDQVAPFDLGGDRVGGQIGAGQLDERLDPRRPNRRLGGVGRSRGSAAATCSAAEVLDRGRQRGVDQGAVLRNHDRPQHRHPVVVVAARQALQRGSGRGVGFFFVGGRAEPGPVVLVAADPPIRGADPIELGRGGGHGQLDQHLLDRRGRDPGHRPHLRIGHPPRREHLRQPRQLLERPRHPHPLTSRRHRQPALPVQPMRRRPTPPPIEALPPIELADQHQPGALLSRPTTRQRTDLRLQPLPIQPRHIQQIRVDHRHHNPASLRQEDLEHQYSTLPRGCDSQGGRRRVRVGTAARWVPSIAPAPGSGGSRRRTARPGSPPRPGGSTGSRAPRH